jgi:hypothetical protein
MLMSASPQLKVPFVYSARPLRELELMRLIGNTAWNSTSESQAFHSIALGIVRLTGFIGFRFEPLAAVPHLPPYETVRSRRNATDSFARAEVTANGRAWGEIRLFLDSNAPLAVESPLRLARFIAQQVGLMLNRLAIQRDWAELATRLEQIRNIINRRKLIHNAAGVLAKRRDISGAEAISFMASYAKRTGRSLLDISQSLILGCNTAMITRPFPQGPTPIRPPGRRKYALGAHK